MNHEFRPGEVITYPYLWAWQQQRGETEGRTRRPVCVVIAIRSAGDGNTHLVLLAITTQPPEVGRVGLEIPDIERGAPVSVISNRVGSSSTNTITISSSAPGTSSLIRRFLVASASPS